MLIAHESKRADLPPELVIWELTGTCHFEVYPCSGSNNMGFNSAAGFPVTELHLWNYTDKGSVTIKSDALPTRTDRLWTFIGHF